MKYSPNHSLHLQMGFSRFEPATERFVFRPKQVPFKLAQKMDDVRIYLKGSGRRVLYVAIRQPAISAEWRVGRFQIDTRGRCRFYDGWRSTNGLLLIATKRPFPPTAQY